MAEIVRFHIEDKVAWNEKRFPVVAESMKVKYGEGPFIVVGVRLHVKEARTTLPDAHPESVTIELKDGQRREFSGDWFKKV